MKLPKMSAQMSLAKSSSSSGLPAPHGVDALRCRTVSVIPQATAEQVVRALPQCKSDILKVVGSCGVSGVALAHGIVTGNPFTITGGVLAGGVCLGSIGSLVNCVKKNLPASQPLLAQPRRTTTYGTF